jgi:hypothetical protein
MTKILAFDSMYIVNPLRKVYTALISRILNEKKATNTGLVLYRLDQDNVLIRDKRNVSGMAVGTHKDHIDAMSIKFYQYLKKSGSCNALSIKDVPLYQLYTRQVKLKLEGVLRCALRIRKLSIESKDNLEITTDRQTIAIMEKAFLFLNDSPTNITWKAHGLLTSCITINSVIMRCAAIVKMLISPSDLPREYYYKHVDSNAPTVLITMPKRRPEVFFSTYVEEFSSQFNIVLYSMGLLQVTPNNYKRIEIKRTTGALHGIFNIKNICWTSSSYIADILLIYKKHANLSTGIDVVNSIFSNKIDAHVSRLQTSVVDNYLVNEARRRGVFILGDVFEEVYYCDSAICSSKSEHTESLTLALANGGKVAYKGSNSLINYRLKNFSEQQFHYLHELLEVETQKKIIFYASDPSKEETQRYLTEKFLIDYFSRSKEFVFVIKTHPQDNGKVTNYAYLDSGSPSNINLIGDITQRGKIISKRFLLFDDFDFNAAVSSCDGFLTTSSSSILQALVLEVKAGIVDKFNNGYYDYLVNYKATMLINSEESLRYFLKNQKLDVSDNILGYCGLKNDNEEFDVGRHLLKCLGKFDKNNENKQPTGI